MTRNRAALIRFVVEASNGARLCTWGQSVPVFPTVRSGTDRQTDTGRDRAAAVHDRGRSVTSSPKPGHTMRIKVLKPTLLSTHCSPFLWCATVHHSNRNSLLAAMSHASHSPKIKLKAINFTCATFSEVILFPQSWRKQGQLSQEPVSFRQVTELRPTPRHFRACVT